MVNVIKLQAFISTHVHVHVGTTLPQWVRATCSESVVGTAMTWQFSGWAVPNKSGLTPVIASEVFREGEQRVNVLRKVLNERLKTCTYIHVLACVCVWCSCVHGTCTCMHTVLTCTYILLALFICLLRVHVASIATSRARKQLAGNILYNAHNIPCL